MKKDSFFYSIVETEFGGIAVVRRQERARFPVCRIFLPNPECVPTDDVRAEFPEAVFRPDLPGGICRQIADFLEGREIVFDSADIDSGCVRGFAGRVLTRAAEIPRGRVMTYGGLAASIGVPGGARAVGGALAGNPLPLIFPCHRVIRGDGTLGGFGGGLDLKKTLLTREGVSFDRRGRVMPNHL